MAKSRALCKCGCELLAEHGVKDYIETSRKCFKCGEDVKFKSAVVEAPAEAVKEAPVKQGKVKKAVKKSKKFKAK